MNNNVLAIFIKKEGKFMSNLKCHQTRLNSLNSPIQQRNFHAVAATDQQLSKAHRTEKPAARTAADLGAILKKIGGGHSRSRQPRH